LVFLIIIVALILLLFVLPKIIQKKKPQEVPSPLKKQQGQTKHQFYQAALDQMFEDQNHTVSKPKVTFRIDPAHLNPEFAFKP
jgi:hypothetical protein